MLVLMVALAAANPPELVLPTPIPNEAPASEDTIPRGVIEAARKQGLSITRCLEHELRRDPQSQIRALTIVWEQREGQMEIMVFTKPHQPSEGEMRQCMAQKARSATRDWEALGLADFELTWPMSGHWEPTDEEKEEFLLKDKGVHVSPP
ncbi:MAG: hypothetical protein HN348_05055 [Proteobacteria bacterium]|nr:hypothetical protein [Pseudomonadota bacterium]